MSLDWTSGPLAEGLRCYRNSEIFLAHEHWEGVWLNLREPEKSFLQALIQTAAAFHHLNAGNAVGSASLLRSRCGVLKFVRQFSEASPQGRYAGNSPVAESAGIRPRAKFRQTFRPSRRRITKSEIQYPSRLSTTFSSGSPFVNRAYCSRKKRIASSFQPAI